MNKFQSVLDFIQQYPYAGYNMYFNFVDHTGGDGNTSLLTDGYGAVIRKYTDGGKLKKLKCVIRQNKPLSTYSNTNENAEQLQAVQEFLDWINEQGEKKNFPDFGEDCTVQGMSTPEGVEYPMQSSVYEGTALYSFPFEIIYTERM